jgi:hypothetical protein
VKQTKKTLARQRGALFIVMATVLVLGFAWFVVAAMGRTGVMQAERDAKTAAALQAGKKALLSHVAQYAGRTGVGYEFPGRMPCPESLNAYGTASEGEAPGACSNVAVEIGRLPWKTLGIDQLRDGDNEPLWYALSPNFHPVAFPLNPAPPNPYLNFATPAALPFDGTNVVAVILAPGRAVKSNPCSGVVQTINRYALPLEPRKFFECDGVAGGNNGTGVPYYTNPGTGSPSNDHALAITQAEWADAIAGPVADRIQREVAAVMGQFRSTVSNTSWGRQFLPFASSWNSLFNAPPANNLCGNQDVYTGMPPTATVASGACVTDWTGGSAGGLGGLLNFVGCTPSAAELSCRFTAILPGIISPTISATAPRIGHSFRSFDPASVQFRRNGGPWQTPTLRNYAGTVDWNGNATVQIEIEFALLTLIDVIDVRIPNPTDVLQTDVRSAWFVGNGWDRFTYYALTRAATVNPGGADCDPGGDISDCLTVTGMPSPANDKRLVLALMGRAPIAPAAWPSADPADYMEGANASPTDRVFETRTVTATFNDRLAACPFSYTDGGGTVITLCN